MVIISSKLYFTLIYTDLQKILEERKIQRESLYRNNVINLLLLHSKIILLKIIFILLINIIINLIII